MREHVHHDNGFSCPCHDGCPIAALEERRALLCRAEAAEYRRFRRLSQELIEAGDALSEARLRAGSGSGAAAAAGAEKGFSGGRGTRGYEPSSAPAGARAPAAGRVTGTSGRSSMVSSQWPMAIGSSPRSR